MIRAMLDARKTQTRRILKPQPVINEAGLWRVDFGKKGFAQTDHVPSALELADALPFSPGDRLYVREAHSLHQAHGQDRIDDKRWGSWGGLPTKLSPDRKQIAYFRERFDRSGHGKWRPSIHMPRWASRLTLTVTNVRVERLQAITRGDAMSEGCPFPNMAKGPNPCDWFSQLWDEINGTGAWAADPWVVAVRFEVSHSNIDHNE